MRVFVLVMEECFKSVSRVLQKNITVKIFVDPRRASVERVGLVQSLTFRLVRDASRLGLLPLSANTYSQQVLIVEAVHDRVGDVVYSVK